MWGEGLETGEVKVLSLLQEKKRHKKNKDVLFTQKKAMRPLSRNASEFNQEQKHQFGGGGGAKKIVTIKTPRR